MAFSPAAFSVRNPIAANLILVILVFGGLYFVNALPREIFPPIKPQMVTIRVIYPGSTPSEVEKGLVVKIEEAVHDVKDVEKIRSTISEGFSTIAVMFFDHADMDQAVNDVKAKIDQIDNLPEDADKIEVRKVEVTLPVISVVLYGDTTERNLRAMADDLRDELVDRTVVTNATVTGVREREISVEVDPAKLEEYGLTFFEVASQIGADNIDIPGGNLKAAGGDIRIRTLGEREQAHALEEIIIRADRTGRTLRLSDVATVEDGFKDVTIQGRHMGERSAMIAISKTGDQDAVRIAREVRAFVESKQSEFQGAVKIDTRDDTAVIIEERLQLVAKNAFWGLVLILLCLSIFLNFRIAFWTAAGVPIAILGTFVVMRMVGYTTNVITLFAMIVVLGMVVDDAIILGENVFRRFYLGASPEEAAIGGANEVILPILGTITTTIAAFAPLGFMSGQMGEIFRPMSGTVIAALVISVLEAFFILPSHLHGALSRSRRDHVRVTEEDEIIYEARPDGGRLHKAWIAKENFLNVTLPARYVRLLKIVIGWRYVSMTVIVTVFFLTLVLIANDRPPQVLMQELDSDVLAIDLEMVSGTPVERTSVAVEQIERAALALPERRTVFSMIGQAAMIRTPMQSIGLSDKDPATMGQILVELERAENRERSSDLILADLRDRVGVVDDSSVIHFQAISGGPGGSDFEVRVRGDNLERLNRAVDYVKAQMNEIEGITDIRSNLSAGKIEARVDLKPMGRLLGLSVRDLAMQLRNAVFGAEAQTLQRGNDEVEVRVRLARDARDSVADLERMRIATPEGGRVPLMEVGDVRIARGYTTLSRYNRKRAVTVEADLDSNRTDVPAHTITEHMEKAFADIGTLYPGVTVEFGGETEELAKSNASLRVGMLFALFVIYSILALTFRSYSQPFIVMIAIPFGLIGAVFGHLLLDHPLSMASWIGIVALTGIVVNDSLLLIEFINRERRKGIAAHDAIVAACRTRLRPILLTSITTIAGLGPIMLEQSFQAQTLIPMAISLSFGLAFSTVLVLLQIPCLYFILHDAELSLRYLWTGRWEDKILIAAAESESA